MRIRHREYLADVAGVTTFGVVSYNVNPGLAASFPWLSTIAMRFEKYRFHKLHFLYETTRSASTNGSVEGVIDFDAADAAPTTKADMLAYSNAVRSAVWEEFRFDARSQDLSQFTTTRFTRDAALAANLDVKTYDVGVFHMGAAGCADTSAIGELYVEYDVELYTPQKNAAASAAAILSQHYEGENPTTADVFGTQTSLTGEVVAIDSGNVLTFSQAGRFLVTVSIRATSVVFVSATPGAGNALVTSFYDSGGRQAGTTTGNFAYMLAVDAVVGGTLTYAFTITTGTLAEYVITDLGGIAVTPPSPLDQRVAQLERLISTLTTEVDLTASVQLSPEQKSSGAWLKVK